MTAERWKQMESLFQSALERDPLEQDAYLNRACSGDVELRREIDQLLAAHNESSFLRQGAASSALRAVEQCGELRPGEQLGPYIVEAHLASGGMGMVYRARDTRLHRTVAIKILRIGSAGVEMRARLKREAQSIAKLQHPNICALFDVGEQGGREYLVMEHLVGETLAERLRAGPFRLDLALEYAIQIADALDQAHRRNIIHRDLKPGNVMVTKTGAKLLDFGLASWYKSSGPTLLDKTMDATDVTASAPLTVPGTLAGTLPYMAPEQVRGETVDARTDIFAFGLVLYEMLAGRRAFNQPDRIALSNAILHESPPALGTVRAKTPEALERAVNICLAKDADGRWQSAGDLKRELAWIAAVGAKTPAARPIKARRAVLAGLALLCTIAAGFAGYRLHSTPSLPSLRFSLPPPPGAAYLSGSELALSPDGTYLVFSAIDSEGKDMLWMRPLKELSAQPISGSEGARHPFWSPDGRRLAFFVKGHLAIVELSGGPIQVVCDAPNGQSGAWGPDNTILFVPRQFSSVHRVSASGGRPVPVVPLDRSREDYGHFWPSFLPDGRHFVFTALSNRHAGKLYVASLDNKESKVLGRSFGRTIVHAGAVYFIDGGLKSQSFDTRRMDLSGEPRTVGSIDWAQSFDLAASGMLVYRSAGRPAERELVWLDRSGQRMSSALDVGPFQSVALSPDGRAVAAVMGQSNETVHIEVFKLSHLVRNRLTQNAALDYYPVWSPDGRRLAYASKRNGHADLFMRAANGSAEEELLLESETDKVPRSWSSDGRYLSASEYDNKGKYVAWILPLFGTRKPFRFCPSQYSVSMSEFSPDGKWVAYWSDESGHAEIFVAGFPECQFRKQVSINGGHSPRWRRDGKELFYVEGNKLMAVPVATGQSLEYGTPHWLFDLPVKGVGDPYASMDGRRFLVISSMKSAESQPVVAVVNAVSRN